MDGLSDMLSGRDDLRDTYVTAMRRVASSVSVVTTEGAAGRFGVTVSAMTSVCADPPMLLVCINRQSPAANAVLANGAFTINVLAADQVEVAATFSGRPLRGAPYDFKVAHWADVGRDLAPAPPRLIGSAAAFVCTLLEAHEGGTHSIFIGSVAEAFHGEGEPLVYGNRLYGRHSVFEAGRVHLGGNA